MGKKKVQKNQQPQLVDFIINIAKSGLLIDHSIKVSPDNGLINRQINQSQTFYTQFK